MVLISFINFFLSTIRTQNVNNTNTKYKSALMSIITHVKDPLRFIKTNNTASPPYKRPWAAKKGTHNT